MRVSWSRLKQGVVTISLGTAGAICKYWDEVKTEQETRIGWSAYISEGSWVTEGVINTAAASLRWLRDVVFPGESYDVINEEAERAREHQENVMFYPYLSGATSPDYYPDSEGCFYGMNLGTTRGGLALAVMEGVAFQIRIILEAMKATEDVHTIVLFGGGAKSSIWSQIIADVTGMKIVVPETAEAAGAGAAVLAGLAAGEFKRNSLPSLNYKKVYEPGEREQEYREKFERYRKIEYKLWR